MTSLPLHTLVAEMFPNLTPLLAAQINELWYALPLVVVVSVVYAGTRYERPDDILVGSVRSIVWVCGFMGIIFVVLKAISLLM